MSHLRKALILIFPMLATASLQANALDWEKLQEKVEEQLGLRTKDDKEAMLNGEVRTTKTPKVQPKAAPAAVPAPGTAPITDDTEFPLPPPKDVAARIAVQAQPVQPVQATQPTQNAIVPPVQRPVAPVESKTNDQTLTLLTNLIERQNALEKTLTQLNDHLSKQNEVVNKLAQTPVPAPVNGDAEKTIQALLKRIDGMEKQLAAKAEAPKTEKTAEAPVEKKTEPARTVQITDPSPAQEVALTTPAADQVPGTLEDLNKLFEELSKPRLGARAIKVYTPEAQNFRDQARSAYSTVVKQGTDKEARLEAFLGLANMALEDGQPEEALTAFTHLIREFPEDERVFNARIEAARLQINKGDFETGRENLNYVLDRKPKDSRVPEMLFEIARSHDDAKDTERALSLYRDVLRRYPQASICRKVLWRKSELLYRLQRYGQAQASYAELAGDKSLVNEFAVAAQLGVGRCLLAEGKPSEAREAFQKALDGRIKDEEGGEALYWVARTYEMEEQPMEAARAFATAANTYPDYARMPECRWRSQENFASLDLNGMAAEQCQRLLKDVNMSGLRFKARVEPSFLLALIRAERGRIHFDDARRGYREFSRRYPHHPLLALAEIEEAEMVALEKRVPDAIKLLEQIAANNSDTPVAVRALMRKAELEEKMETPAKAADTIRRFDNADVDSETAGAFSLRRALYLLDLHREEEALALLRRMSGDPLVAPKFAWVARFQVGVALERQGKVDDAIKAYQAFIEQASQADSSKDEEVFALIQSAKWKIKTLQNLQSLSRVTAQVVRKETP